MNWRAPLRFSLISATITACMMGQVAYKLPGLDFGPYLDGQNPNQNLPISQTQIQQRMSIIAPYTSWIRTFGCTNGLDKSGLIAHGLGLKAAIGIWIGPDLAANNAEIACGIAVAQSGNADMIIVGSEVLRRGDVSEQQLVTYIQTVRQQVPYGVPVTSAEVYWILLFRPAIVQASDVVLANFYPFWEGYSVGAAVGGLNLAYEQLVTAASGKTVLVSETGWPSGGNTVGAAVPSPANAAAYFLNFVSWARAKNVQYFYFEAFDEAWKAQYEGPQGAAWGLWDHLGNLKPGMQAVFDGQTVPNNWSGSINPTSRPFDSSGGTGSVNVTAPVGWAWTAVSNADWLTVRGGGSGSGNGVVSYFVAANFGAPRDGTISIAGERFTVNQAAPGGLPGVVGVVPASGTGASQTLTFTFSHSAGWQSVGVVNVLINFWLDGSNSCYLAYSRPSNTLYLINNAGNGNAGSMPLNGSGTLGNSQCVISGAGSSASGNGNTMALTLNMSFPASFAGTKILYAAVRDVAENNSGWQRMGVWKVPGAAQTTTTAVVGMNPARGSGGDETFAFTFTDTNGAGDLGVMNILVNDWLDGRHACYLAYARRYNALYLLNDNGDGLLPGLSLSGPFSLSNSQCTVHGAGSSATVNGNTLTLTLTMTFVGRLVGNRVFYVAARDVNELNNTGWQAMGSWTVQ